MSNEKERNDAEMAFKKAFASALKNTAADAYVEEDTGFIVIPAKTVQKLREERKNRRSKENESQRLYPQSEKGEKHE